MRILVTGATGFIGGRIVEMFLTSGFATLRAGVRKASDLTRLQPLQVEVVPCEIMDATQTRSAVAGMDAVVHCARGPRPVMVDGTRNLLQASLEAGVRRFVYLSTIDVYGNAVGEVDESTPLQHTGAEYGDSKIDAEEACREYVQKGLSVSVLRPTIVYGPFSANWTIEFAERLQVRPWPFPEALSGGTCNLLYVDDLVEAVKLALTAPEAVGEAFNVNGPDRPSWYEYFRALNAAMGLPPMVAQGTSGASMRAVVVKPVRSVARYLKRHFGGPILALAGRFTWAKKILDKAEAHVRKEPTAAELSLYGRSVSFSSGKAAKLLHFQPSVDMDQGIERSVRWLRANGFAHSDLESKQRTDSA